MTTALSTYTTSRDVTKHIVGNCADLGGEGRFAPRRRIIPKRSGVPEYRTPTPDERDKEWFPN